MSNAPVPPLGKDEIPDLYVDNIPLACKAATAQRLCPETGRRNTEGPLAGLWEDVGDLFALRRLTFTSEDNTPRLVRALADGR